MQHCCKFKAAEIYFLADNYLCTERKLSVGICPICSKPVAELHELRFDGHTKKLVMTGIKADDFVYQHKNEILYTMQEHNLRSAKSKPYGWRYGVNKTAKSKGKTVVKQFAYDFYGNKECIKTI